MKIVHASLLSFFIHIFFLSQTSAQKILIIVGRKTEIKETFKFTEIASPVYKKIFFDWSDDDLFYQKLISFQISQTGSGYLNCLYSKSENEKTLAKAALLAINILKMQLTSNISMIGIGNQGATIVSLLTHFFAEKSFFENNVLLSSAQAVQIIQPTNQINNFFINSPTLYKEAFLKWKEKACLKYKKENGFDPRLLDEILKTVSNFKQAANLTNPKIESVATIGATFDKYSILPHFWNLELWYNFYSKKDLAVFKEHFLDPAITIQQNPLLNFLDSQFLNPACGSFKLEIVERSFEQCSTNHSASFRKLDHKELINYWKCIEFFLINQSMIELPNYAKLKFHTQLQPSSIEIKRKKNGSFLGELKKLLNSKKIT